MRIYTVSIGTSSFQVGLGSGGEVTVDGVRVPVEIRQTGPFLHLVSMGGTTHRLLAGPSALGTFFLVADGSQHEAAVRPGSGREGAGGQDAPLPGTMREVRAPMPALVTRVEVVPGTHVESGQGLVILEAMKMENEIKAPRAGTVVEVKATPGKPVEKGELLILLE